MFFPRLCKLNLTKENIVHSGLGTRGGSLCVLHTDAKGILNTLNTDSEGVHVHLDETKEACDKVSDNLG